MTLVFDTCDKGSNPFIPKYINYFTLKINDREAEGVSFENYTIIDYSVSSNLTLSYKKYFLFVLNNHFVELRHKILYSLLSVLLSFFSSYINVVYILCFISKPFLVFFKNDNFDFVFTNFIDVLEVCVFVVLYFCLFFNGPICFYFFYSFVRSGLYCFEKQLFSKCFLFFIFNFYFSCFCIYFFVFPFSLSFIFNLKLLQNDDFLVLKLIPRITDYVYSFVKLLFLYGFFIFQIPTVFFIINSFLKTKSFFFYQRRKIVILLNIFICLIFSPPDLISCFFLILPLFFITEFTFFFFTLKELYIKKANRKLLER
jgi:sec-independent protein translocase protein TatC